LRYPLAYDRRLCADVLAAFVGALRRLLRWRAKRELGLRSVEDTLVGAVTFILDFAPRQALSRRDDFSKAWGIGSPARWLGCLL
jgi:hypothetical protein